MKSLFIILCSSAMLLFSGCYTQLYVEEESPTVAEPQVVAVADTFTYVYFPQNEFIPIDGVVPEAESPIMPISGEIEQLPQATDQWLVTSNPTEYPSEYSSEVNADRIDLFTQPQRPHFFMNIPVHEIARTHTVTTTPVTTVRRTSGVERSANQNPTPVSTHEDTRNSGTTRRGRR